MKANLSINSLAQATWDKLFNAAMILVKGGISLLNALNRFSTALHGPVNKWFPKFSSDFHVIRASTSTIDFVWQNVRVGLDRAGLLRHSGTRQGSLIKIVTSGIISGLAYVAIERRDWNNDTIIASSTTLTIKSLIDLHQAARNLQRVNRSINPQNREKRKKVSEYQFQQKLAQLIGNFITLAGAILFRDPAPQEGVPGGVLLLTGTVFDIATRFILWSQQCRFERKFAPQESNYNIGDDSVEWVVTNIEPTSNTSNMNSEELPRFYTAIPIDESSNIKTETKNHFPTLHNTGDIVTALGSLKNDHKEGALFQQRPKKIKHCLRPEQIKSNSRLANARNFSVVVVLTFSSLAAAAVPHSKDELSLTPSSHLSTSSIIDEKEEPKNRKSSLFRHNKSF